MKHISIHIKRAVQKARQTERGELMEYFCKELNSSRLRDGLPPISMGRMGEDLGEDTHEGPLLSEACLRRFKEFFPRVLV